MAEVTEKPRTAVTLNQGVLIGVLAAALIGAIMFGQPAGESVDPAPVETVAVTPNVAQSQTPAAVVPGSKPAANHWPAVTLDKTLQHNPFQQPEGLLDLNGPPAAAAAPSPEDVEKADAEAAELARREKQATALAEWQNKRVKMVLRMDDKLTAVVGDRIVHEGDVIDGIRVVSILPSGVMIEPVPAD